MPASRNDINNGWTIKPLAKSVTAILANKRFPGECKEVVFQIVTKPAEYPTTAAKKRGTFTKQIANAEYLFC